MGCRKRAGQDHRLFAEPDCRDSPQPVAYHGGYGAAARPLFRQQRGILDEPSDALRFETGAAQTQAGGCGADKGEPGGVSTGRPLSGTANRNFAAGDSSPARRRTKPGPPTCWHAYREILFADTMCLCFRLILVFAILPPCTKETSSLAQGCNQEILRDALPESWRHAAESEKSLLEWPPWSTEASVQRAPAGRDRLHTTAGERAFVVIPLREKSGPGLEGVRLRLTVWAFRRESDVTATLEVPDHRFVTIARVDAWPSDPHPNTRARKVPALRHLPRMVEGHHVHRFADNARLGREAFRPPANLPVAAPIDQQLRSFRDFVRCVAAEFRIDGLDDFDPPDTWRMLL